MTIDKGKNIEATGIQEEKLVSSDSIDTTVEQATSAVAGAQRTELARALEDVMVLHCDDEPMVLRAVSRYLQFGGAVSISTNDPRVVREFCSDDTLKPGSLILLDDNIRNAEGSDIPSERGVELAAEIRAMRPDLVIVIMSGSLSEKEANELVQKGIIDGSIPKPFPPSFIEELAQLRKGRIDV